jgi:hypothetical protein
VTETYVLAEIDKIARELERRALNIEQRPLP